MTNVVVAECPICGNSKFKTELRVHDHAVSQREFTIQSCTACRLWLTNPRPTETDLPAFYQSATYISHQKSSRSLTDRIYFMARSLMLRTKLNLIEKLQSKGKLLDYGCGTGAFLAYAEKNGWNATGYEPSAQAATAAPYLRIVNSADELCGTFDVITLWHVLEHLPQLKNELHRITALLAPGGLLVVAVPNRESWDARHYRAMWAAYDVPRHLWHFNPHNISALFAAANLKPVAIRPLPFDSFFVSLLSERYKKTVPLIAFATALWHGLFSNWQARRTTNYSSLIYLARK